MEDGDCSIETVDPDEGVKDVVDAVEQRTTEKEGRCSWRERENDCLSVGGLVGELIGGVGTGSLSPFFVGSKERCEGHDETVIEPAVE